MGSDTLTNFPGQAILSVELPVYEDIGAEIDDFLALSLLGLEDEARDLAQTILWPHLRHFPVFAEVADYAIDKNDELLQRQLLRSIREQRIQFTQPEERSFLETVTEILDPGQALSWSWSDVRLWSLEFDQWHSTILCQKFEIVMMFISRREILLGDIDLMHLRTIIQKFVDHSLMSDAARSFAILAASAKRCLKYVSPSFIYLYMQDAFFQLTNHLLAAEKNQGIDVGQAQGDVLLASISFIELLVSKNPRDGILVHKAALISLKEILERTRRLLIIAFQTLPDPTPRGKYFQLCETLEELLNEARDGDELAGKPSTIAGPEIPKYATAKSRSEMLSDPTKLDYQLKPRKRDRLVQDRLEVERPYSATKPKHSVAKASLIPKIESHAKDKLRMYDSSGEKIITNDLLKDLSVAARVFLNKNVVTKTFLQQGAQYLRRCPHLTREVNLKDWSVRARNALHMGDAELARMFIQQAWLLEMSLKHGLDGLEKILRQDSAFSTCIRSTYTTFLTDLSQAEDESLLAGARREMLVPWARFVYWVCGEDILETLSLPPDSISADWATEASAERHTLYLSSTTSRPQAYAVPSSWRTGSGDRQAPQMEKLLTTYNQNIDPGASGGKGSHFQRPGSLSGDAIPPIWASSRRDRASEREPPSRSMKLREQTTWRQEREVPFALAYRYPAVEYRAYADRTPRYDKREEEDDDQNLPLKSFTRESAQHPHRDSDDNDSEDLDDTDDEFDSRAAYTYTPHHMPPFSQPRRMPTKPVSSRVERRSSAFGSDVPPQAISDTSLRDPSISTKPDPPVNPIYRLSRLLIAFVGQKSFLDCLDFCRTNPRIFEEDISLFQSVAIDMYRQDRSDAAERVIERWVMLKEALREANSSDVEPLEYMKRLPAVPARREALRTNCDKVQEALKERIASPPTSRIVDATRKGSIEPVRTARSSKIMPVSDRSRADVDQRNQEREVKVSNTPMPSHGGARRYH